VVDLPTAFYVVAAELEDGVIVGQFPAAGEQERFGVVLEKDSPLTACVDAALATLREAGTLEEIQQEWLSDKVDAPVLE
jgi:polar amino acid transport system substrate-binding protein